MFWGRPMYDSTASRRQIFTRSFVRSLALIGTCALGSAFAEATPIEAPREVELCGVRSVVHARFVSYHPSPITEGATGYLTPPVARFQLVRVLRGEPLPTEIGVRFDFHDGSACLPREGWHFSEARMPRPLSEWVLFLTDERDGVYRTYRGDFGRAPWGAEAESRFERCGVGDAAASMASPAGEQ